MNIEGLDENFRVVARQTNKLELIETTLKKRAELTGKLVQLVTSRNRSQTWVQYFTEKSLLLTISAYTDQLVQYQAAIESEKFWGTQNQQQ
jgi:hypothetical protein